MSAQRIRFTAPEQRACAVYDDAKRQYFAAWAHAEKTGKWAAFQTVGSVFASAAEHYQSQVSTTAQRLDALFNDALCGKVLVAPLLHAVAEVATLSRDGQNQNKAGQMLTALVLVYPDESLRAFSLEADLFLNEKAPIGLRTDAARVAQGFAETGAVTDVGLFLRIASFAAVDLSYAVHHPEEMAGRENLHRAVVMTIGGLGVAENDIYEGRTAHDVLTLYGRYHPSRPVQMAAMIADSKVVAYYKRGAQPSVPKAP